VFPNGQPPEPLRSKFEFCHLLKNELQTNASYGLISKRKANEITLKCFRSY
jgi:hypothetical protein